MWRWDTRRGGQSRRHQALQLSLELEAELRAFALWQPERHLRKKRAIEPHVHRRPGHDLGRACFGKEAVQELAHLVRIGAGAGGRVPAEQLQLAAVPYCHGRAVVRHVTPLPNREPTEHWRFALAARGLHHLSPQE